MSDVMATKILYPTAPTVYGVSILALRTDACRYFVRLEVPIYVYYFTVNAITRGKEQRSVQTHQIWTLTSK